MIYFRMIMDWRQPIFLQVLVFVFWQYLIYETVPLLCWSHFSHILSWWWCLAFVPMLEVDVEFSVWWLLVLCSLQKIPSVTKSKVFYFVAVYNQALLESDARAWTVVLLSLCWSGGYWAVYVLFSLIFPEIWSDVIKNKSNKNNNKTLHFI